MIKNVIIGIFLTLFLVSCNRTYEKGMKSKDPAFILNSADNLYEQEKWAYAIELYRKAAPSYAGKEESERIALNSAYANFYDKNYELAAKQFKNFYLSFNNSPVAEEALYMSAFSYYQGSPDYNLDQSNTYEALRELQNFIDTYPESERVETVNGYIDELQKKLERKAFEIAKSYYNTLKYKAATVSFANFMDDFPDSYLREEAFIYLLRSRAELGIQSVYDKKENRLKDAATTYRLFVKTFPESSYLDEANDWSDRINREIQAHQKLQAEIEERNEQNNQIN
ncbi:outer membrane protein assembly factor BamD [Flavobacteriaceae bacterium Ap0902]|nr:outer membrane protein assembly factor BamD [Flavobacteriaceae bacterium Ap0902]